VSESRLSSRLSMLPFVLTASLLAATGPVAVAATPPGKPLESPDILLLGVNLVVNPDFNTGLSGWSAFDPSAVSWDPTNDQAGDSNSGSAFILSPSTSGIAALYQCINLPADWRSRNLSLTYWTYTGNGAPPGNGNGLVILYYFDAQNCLNGAFAANQLFSNYTNAVWVQSGSPIFPPDLSQSVGILLGSANTAPGISTGINFDTVFFGYTPVTGTCGEDPTLLCVDNNRFQVTAQFSQACATGSSSADGVQISSVGGFLWCFDPSNPEIFVKVLNACTPATGNTYWVFISGLTNIGVTVTVTDTKTGQHKSYTNPNGTPFASIEDTVGLQVCP
jgi:hypothetical protein